MSAKREISRYHCIIAALAARTGGEVVLTEAELDAVVGLSMDIDSTKDTTTVRVFLPKKARPQ